jgi:hypothetical protein
MAVQGPSRKPQSDLLRSQLQLPASSQQADTYPHEALCSDGTVSAQRASASHPEFSRLLWMRMHDPCTLHCLAYHDDPAPW